MTTELCITWSRPVPGPDGSKESTATLHLPQADNARAEHIVIGKVRHIQNSYKFIPPTSYGDLEAPWTEDREQAIAAARFIAGHELDLLASRF